MEKTGGCWKWRGSRDSHGYGRLQHDGVQRKAHRVSYELHVGPIPDGLPIDHLCRNRGCVNPAHLQPISSRENTVRGESVAAANARKTRCSRGHAFTLGNTYRRSNGGRGCRACRREHVAAHRARHPEETRERARAAATDKRATPDGRAAYNAYMREYHCRTRAAKRAG